MIGSIVPTPLEQPAARASPLDEPVANTDSTPDPLSEVLALLKPKSYASGGFVVPGDLAIFFPAHTGIKCYAMLAGDCWLAVEGVEPVHLTSGDCFLLPRGLPFTLTTDLALEPVHYSIAKERFSAPVDLPALDQNTRYIAGGFFGVDGGPARMLLESLPPVVHLRRESDKAALRWCLERLRDELRNPQPGGTLITEQIAYMMLVQALRLHLTDAAQTRPGWLHALADPHMSQAIAAIHETPGQPWTVETLAQRVGMSRSVFALRFREIVGTTPLDYLTRWRMFLAADRLATTRDGLCKISADLGYDSESAFGKAFRRVMGVSPRQYTRSGA